MLNSKEEFIGFDLEKELKEKEDVLISSVEGIKKRANFQTDWLGWLRLHERKEDFQEIQEYADKIMKSDLENLVVLGIGGSALGPQALIQALLSPLWNELSKEKRNNGLKIYFIDNVDPDWTNEILSSLNIKKTLFCTVTKSGGTAETISAFLWARERLIKELGEKWTENLVLVTDPEKGTLRAFAKENNVKAFAVPPSVGGRFSVFSAVGMLPLALLGIKIEKFRAALEKAYDKFLNVSDIKKSLPVRLATALFSADKKLGKIMNVLMPYSTHLSKVSDWYVQLVAESLGKNPETGPTPIKAVGATDQHSQLQLFSDGPKDKLIFFLKVLEFKNNFQIPEMPVKGFERLAGKTLKKLITAECDGTAKALNEKKVPNLTLELKSINEESLAELLYCFEIMTAIAGDLYGVDPFDQPGVELSKKYTYEFLG